MKLIYVASPYAGDIKKNIEYAKQACRYVLNEGNAALGNSVAIPCVDFIMRGIAYFMRKFKEEMEE